MSFKTKAIFVALLCLVSIYLSLISIRLRIGHFTILNGGRLSEQASLDSDFRALEQNHVSDVETLYTELSKEIQQRKNGYRQRVQRLIASLQSREDQFNITLNKPPVIVFGTAGSGTRIASRVLRGMNVAVFTEIVNRQDDSLVIIQLVKETAMFCCGNSSLFHHFAERINHNGTFVYEVEDIDPILRNQITKALRLAFRIIQYEVYLKSGRSLDVSWGIKEPQLIYLIPFILDLHPDAILVHTIRDGRDAVLSKQQKMRYQQMYLNKIYRSGDLMATAQLWQRINLDARSIALRHQLRTNYILARLEDLCYDHRRQMTLSNIERLLQQFGIVRTYNTATSNSVDIDQSRCNMGKWLNTSLQLNSSVFKSIWKPLLEFGYEGLQSGTSSVQMMSNVGLPLWPQNSTVIITAVSQDYLDLFNTFLDTIEQHCFGQRLQILVLNLDLESAQVNKMSQRQRHHIQHVSVDNIMQKKDIWKWRLEMASMLIDQGNNVVLSDLDAIWNVNVVQYFEQDQFGGYDLIAGQGRFPYELKSLWGFTACMGMVYIRSSTQSSTLLHLTLRYLKMFPDDQKAFNRALWQMSDGWIETEAGYQSASNRSIGIKALVLHHDSLPRFCPSSKVIEQYPKAIAFHCYTPKNGSKKMAKLRQMGII
ncbi:hypothetical protein MP228_011861 [Amoeboaphelidium protococcarum]|nr:hypothetical protein MP228_011861 [Amoeboaphelidium protococcarum]